MKNTHLGQTTPLLGKRIPLRASLSSVGKADSDYKGVDGGPLCLRRRYSLLSSTLLISIVQLRTGCAFHFILFGQLDGL